MYHLRWCGFGVMVLTSAALVGQRSVLSEPFITPAVVRTFSNDSAHPPNDQQRRATLPPDLRCVPADALGFLHVNVQALWRLAAMRASRASAEGKWHRIRGRLSSRIGVPVDDLHTVTVIILNTERPGRPEAGEITAVTTIHPYARDTAVRALVGKAEEKHLSGQTLCVERGGNPGMALCPLTDHTFLVGNRFVLQRYLAAKIRTKGPLADALRLAGQPHAVVLAFHIPDTFARGLRQAPLPPAAAFMKPALGMQGGMAILDATDQQMGLNLRIHYASADAAQHAHDAIKNGLSQLRLVDYPSAATQRLRVFSELLQELTHTLRTADVARRKTFVEVRLRSATAPACAAAMLALEQLLSARAGSKQRPQPGSH